MARKRAFHSEHIFYAKQHIKSFESMKRKLENMAHQFFERDSYICESVYPELSNHIDATIESLKESIDVWKNTPEED